MNKDRNYPAIVSRLWQNTYKKYYYSYFYIYNCLIKHLLYYFTKKYTISRIPLSITITTFQVDIFGSIEQHTLEIRILLYQNKPIFGISGKHVLRLLSLPGSFWIVIFSLNNVSKPSSTLKFALLRKSPFIAQPKQII